MLHLVCALIVYFVAPLLASPANAAERTALLIGNQSYNAKVGKLENPHNDIALIATALRSLKFKVTEVKDADYRSMDTAIKRHVQTVRREGQGAISFVYYSGHGAADPDTKINYLIPVDVANADDDDLWVNSLNLSSVIEGLRGQAPQATHYVVFDACRNELNLTIKGKRVLADRGFVPIAAYTPGVMIAYATAPGKTATDIGKKGAPYAKALADEIIKPGIEAMTMFRRVALRVNREIGQDPWISASTLPEVYFAGEAAVVQPPQALSQGAQSDAEIKLLKEQLAKLESDLKQQQQQASASSDKEIKTLKDELAKSQAELKKRENDQKKQKVDVITPPPKAAPAQPAKVTLSPAPSKQTLDQPDATSISDFARLYASVRDGNSRTLIPAALAGALGMGYDKDQDLRGYEIPDEKDSNTKYVAAYLWDWLSAWERVLISRVQNGRVTEAYVVERGAIVEGHVLVFDVYAYLNDLSQDKLGPEIYGRFIDRLPKT